MAVERYYDLGRLRIAIGLALLVMAAAELAYGVSSWQYLQLAGQIGDGALTDAEIDARWTAYQAFETPMLRIYQIALIACYVLEATWILGAARNAARLVPDPRRISPGGALGWYIVPIANLFVPFQSMRQIFNSSTRPPRELNAPAPSVLRWWWGIWLLVSAIVVITLVLPIGPDGDMMSATALIDVINTPLSVLSLWLWWQVVTLITHLQRAARPDAPTNSAQEVIQ